MAKNPEHYAIVIGINGYNQIPPLRAAEEDATRFAKWLIKENGGGLPSENVKIILSSTSNSANPGDVRPLQRDIDEALTQMGVRVRERIGQRLYFYFAGHGIGPSFDDVGMLMASAAKDQLNINIGLRPYRSFFYDRKPFDEIVFIIDCCRDHTIEGVITGVPSFTLGKNKTERNVQDFVVLAAEYGEQAFEPYDPEVGERRSILTKAVLEGLDELKAVNLLGEVTANSLWKYVRERVPNLTKDPRLQQEPRVSNNLKDDIVICTVPTIELTKIKVRIDTTVPEVGGNLQLFDNRFNPVLDEQGQPVNLPTAQARSGNPWEISLDKGNWYAVIYSAAQNALPQYIDLTGVDSDTFSFTYK